MNRNSCYYYLLKELKKNIVKIIALIGLIAAISLFGLITPIVYQIIIDEVIPQKNLGGLAAYLAILIITPWGVTFLSSLKNYLSAAIGDGITSALREECFVRCLNARYECLEKTDVSSIVYVITREVGKIGEVYITQDVITFIAEAVSLVSVVIAMFAYNYKLSLLCILAFPALLFISGYVSKKAKAMDKKLMDLLNEGQGFLYQALRNIRRIKLSCGNEFETGNWLKWLKKYRNIRLKSSVSHNINRFLMGDLITGMVYGFIFYVGSRQVIVGEMKIGTLIAFIAFVPRVYSSLKNVMNIKVSSSVIKNSVDKIDEILGIEQERSRGIEIDGKIKSISLKNVDFKYKTNEFGVSGICIEAGHNKKIGIVGLTGSGKSTIFDLIVDLYQCNGGEIKVNGANVNDVKLTDLRSKIAIVSQDDSLFNASIKDNILYPKMNISPSELNEAISLLHLNELVSRLPEGVDSGVGENGSLLSGGEKQRILLANALLKNADVILLDEFTSALDVKTERMINDYIFHLENKIVIIITHRTYMINALDYVYYVDNGQIVEEGRPKELLNNCDSHLCKLNRNITY